MEVLFIVIIFVLLVLFLGKDNSSPTYNEEVPKSNIDDYNQLLNCNEWKEKRQEILERDNYMCQWCGNKTNLNVHHKYYAAYPNGVMADPWDYPNKALITLCEDCHKKAHQKYKIKTYHRSYYNSKI